MVAFRESQNYEIQPHTCEGVSKLNTNLDTVDLEQ